MTLWADDYTDGNPDEWKCDSGDPLNDAWGKVWEDVDVEDFDQFDWHYNPPEKYSEDDEYLDELLDLDEDGMFGERVE